MRYRPEVEIAMISSRSSAAWMARRKDRFCVCPQAVLMMSVWYAQGIIV